MLVQALWQWVCVARADSGKGETFLSLSNVLSNTLPFASNPLIRCRLWPWTFEGIEQHNEVDPLVIFIKHSHLDERVFNELLRE